MLGAAMMIVNLRKALPSYVVETRESKEHIPISIRFHIISLQSAYVPAALILYSSDTLLRK